VWTHDLSDGVGLYEPQVPDQRAEEEGETTMTIQQAITMLETAKKKHGPEVVVYFDCPRCGQAFTPSTLVTEALHVGAELPREKK
jgi:uncharacterized protein (UPF0212 family)